MSAILTATGVTFGDSTSLNSKYAVVEQGAAMGFFQAAAPTGWVKENAHNDKALRLVNGTGGGFGFGGTSGAGGLTFSQVFPNNTSSLNVPFSATTVVTGTVGGTTLAISQIPDHTHNSLTGGAASASGGGSNFRVTGSAPTGNVVSPSGQIGQPHDHPFSGQANFSANGAGQIDLRLQYVDVLVCTFS